MIVIVKVVCFTVYEDDVLDMCGSCWVCRTAWPPASQLVCLALLVLLCGDQSSLL